LSEAVGNRAILAAWSLELQTLLQHQLLHESSEQVRMSLTIISLGIVTGLALASIYVLIAVSFTLVLAASGVFNFAQGTLVMLGTVLAFILGVTLGWPPLIAVTAICFLGALGGLLTHLIAVWPVMGRTRSFAHSTMISTIGLGIAANAVVALLFGADSQPVPTYVSDIPVIIGSIPLRPTYIMVIFSGALLTVCIEIILRKTTVGHIFRTTLEDPEGARLLGIDTRKTIAAAFAIAGALSGLAGFLVAPIISASAYTAQELAIYGFAAMAIGGFGSFAGALIGGVIVGLLTGVIPAVANPNLALPLLWIIVVVLLVVKPSGIFGTAGLFGSTKLREI
jgi:branched-chain amino acid transport system permease protein